MTPITLTIQLAFLALLLACATMSYRFMPSYYLEPGCEGFDKNGDANRSCTPEELAGKKTSDRLESLAWGFVVAIGLTGALGTF